MNSREDLVERIRLHEQLSGAGTATTPLAAMLSEGIAIQAGAVNRIGDGQVSLVGGASLDGHLRSATDPRISVSGRRLRCRAGSPAGACHRRVPGRTANYLWASRPRPLGLGLNVTAQRS